MWKVLSFHKYILNKKVSFDKIVAHVFRIDDRNEVWSPENLNKPFSSMIRENVLKLVGGTHKIKPNQENGFISDQNCLEDATFDFFRETFRPSILVSETIIFPRNQEKTVSLFNQMKNSMGDELLKSPISFQKDFKRKWKFFKFSVYQEI